MDPKNPKKGEKSIMKLAFIKTCPSTFVKKVILTLVFRLISIAKIFLLFSDGEKNDSFES